MAREIHDTLAQGFIGIVLQLEAAEQAADDSPAEVVDHLGRAKDLARESLQEARRSVWDLLPHALEQLPLVEALESEVEKFAAGGGESASFSVSGERRELATSVQTAILRICQESLTNVRRHAAATQVAVNLAFQYEAVQLSVQDDGEGFDPEENGPGDGRKGFGLTGMAQRASQLDGSLTVRSRQSEGTVVEVSIPTEMVMEQRGSTGKEAS